MDRTITRRTLLRRTATLTTGVVAASTVARSAAEGPRSDPQTAIAPDHDPATGEIFDRDRHHRWETV